MKPHMYVLNKEGQATIVYPQEMKEGREKDYKTLSGTSLTGEEPKEEVKETSNDSIEQAAEDYKLVFGKAVPPNKKNDIKRIRTKINETLTPAK